MALLLPAFSLCQVCNKYPRHGCFKQSSPGQRGEAGRGWGPPSAEGLEEGPRGRGPPEEPDALTRPGRILQSVSSEAAARISPGMSSRPWLCAFGPAPAPSPSAPSRPPARPQLGAGVCLPALRPRTNSWAKQIGRCSGICSSALSTTEHPPARPAASAGRAPRLPGPRSPQPPGSTAAMAPWTWRRLPSQRRRPEGHLRGPVHLAAGATALHSGARVHDWQPGRPPEMLDV